jgi:translation initiation factor 1 (eIF-1/SUI1)
MRLGVFRTQERNGMGGKKERVDTSAEAATLTSNPFAELLGNFAGTVRESPKDTPEKPAAKPKVRAFSVARTKKGGYLIFLERRAAGKSVTILRNVSGDTEALLALLKKRCAAGGKAFPDSVEVQGEHAAKIEAFLREQGI